uniref:Secreted protein n=1 Tax=Anguilla anguilla TaxID=7936 RepID=A0A0E9PJQ3_ANGAN
MILCLFPILTTLFSCILLHLRRHTCESNKDVMYSRMHQYINLTGTVQHVYQFVVIKTKTDIYTQYIVSNVNVFIIFIIFLNFCTRIWMYLSTCL